MKHKFKAKISIDLISASIAAETSVLSASAKHNDSTITQGETLMPTIQTYWKYGEMYKYQAGRYWNDLDPDKPTSNTPCDDHDELEESDQGVHCKGYQRGYEFGEGYTPLNGMYYPYYYVSQCWGFAKMLASDFYGGCNVWLQLHYENGYLFRDIDQIRVGDQIRIRNVINDSQHSVFVTQVNGNSLKFADCNWDNQCGIRWDVSATVGYYYSNGHMHRTLNFNGYSLDIDYIERPVMAGDVDGDSKITWNDVSAIAQIFLGTYDFSNKDKNVIIGAADLDNDGQISFNDCYLAYYQYDDESNYFKSQRFLTSIDEYAYYNYAW